LLYPFRVARVSRLIGNPDTTAKPPGWQADFTRNRWCGRFPGGILLLKFTRSFPQTHETPLDSSGVSRVLRWSLASEAYGRWLFPPCLLQTPPVGFSLLRAASLAVALTGRLLFSGLAGNFQQPVHHWRLTNSNRHANLAITCFQRLTSVRTTFASAIWEDQAGILLKTIEVRSKTGSAGSSASLVPPAQYAGLAFRRGGRVGRCAGRRNAPVGRIHARPRHPHSPRPRSLPAEWHP